MTMIIFPREEICEVRRGIDPQAFLYISQDSRDSLVAANSYLTILQDKSQDNSTKNSIQSIINHLSDMLYGFDR